MASTTIGSVGSKIIGTPTPGLRGLVLWLKFNEGSGSTVYDSSFYNYRGTIYGGATWVDGRFGKALSFDGSDDYVYCENCKVLSIRYEYTVMALINPINASHIGDFGNERSDWRESCIIDRDWFRPLSLRIYDSAGHLSMAYERTDDSREDVYSSLTITEGVWQLVGYSLSLHTKTVKFFVNDVFEEKSISYGDEYPLKNAGTLQIGRLPNATWYYRGLIDEVRLYERVLSNEEICMLYYNRIGAVSSKTI